MGLDKYLVVHPVRRSTETNRSSLGKLFVGSQVAELPKLPGL